LRHFEIDGNSWTAEPKETASLTCSPQELAQNAQFWASEADKLTPGNTATVITPAWIARYMCTNRGCMDLDRAWPRAAGASLADQDVHRLPPGNRLIESDDLAGGFFIEKDIGGRRAIISDSGAPFRSKEDALRAAIDHPSNRAQGGTTTYQP
jgi:hypothetical protein